MDYLFCKSSLGYRHIESKTVCQDSSSMYRDSQRSIIACADGHGGALYVRSHIGSKCACDAAIDVLRSISPRVLSSKKGSEQIKLAILCEWNKRIERQMASRRFFKKELSKLDSEQREELRFAPIRAYGTTLCAASFLKNKIVIVSIGDSEVIGFKKGYCFRIFDSDDEPVANITYSLCQEDAFDHLKVKILDAKELDGLLLCTDGFSSPYQSYANFYENLIKPVVYQAIKTHSLGFAEKLVEQLASKSGNGDDVSLCLFIKESARASRYKAI